MTAAAEQILAFRLARSGLAAREAPDLAAAAACPASDFARDAALLALAARAEGVTRDRYVRAVAAGEVFLAHSLRGAVHALAPADHGHFGRALVGRDDRELKAQLGEVGRPQTEALAEVTAAVAGALSGGPLGKDDLHAALRQRVARDLLPWCPTCRSHHVAGSLWRYATIAAGARLDQRRRYLLVHAAPDPDPAEAVRRFLRFYGPARPAQFGEWAGVTPAHARRLWDAAELDLAGVEGHGWLLRDDLRLLAAPPPARGLRLLAPGDPFLQKPNRPLLAPDPELRGRLFRPAGSPGAVLHDGRLAGLWRMKGAEVIVEPFATLPRAALADEIERLRAARGSPAG